MICTETDIVGWDTERIRSRLQLYAGYDRSKAGRLSVVRGLYAERIVQGEYLQWDTVKSLGISLNKLRLRASNERVFLGQTVGRRYRLEQVLGIGGIGVVYRAQDLIEDRLVAIKACRAAGDEFVGLARRLMEREIEVLSDVRHPCIAGIIETITQADDVQCLVLEYVEGRTVFELVKQGPVLPTRAAEIAAMLADAVYHLHERGIFHRDLSDGNIIIDEGGCPHLLDPGLALTINDQFDREGEAVGTWGYEPLESIVGTTSRIDARSDVWALGAILYQLLASKRLAGDSKEESFVDIALLKMQPPDYPKNCPRELQTICNKSIAPEMNDRYDTAREMATALREFLDNCDR